MSVTRPAEPRLPVLSDDQLTEEQAEVLEPVRGFQGGTLNLFATLVHHPKLLKRWRVFGAHVLFKSTLSPRERELLILRTAWNCRASYEWGHHVEIGRGVGLTDTEIDNVPAGPDAGIWSAGERALLAAADELHSDQCISDATWAVLGADHSPDQLIDIIFTVGQYTVVSMALNSLGVPLEEGVPDLPGEPA